MRIETADFGVQEIDPNTILEFPEGIPGFENDTRFKLFNEEEAEQVFHLQSVTNPDVAFSVVDPAKLHIFYEIALTDDELTLLGSTDPEHIGILVFTYRNTTAPEANVDTSGLAFSFMTPIIINVEEKRGFMKVLSNTSQQITIKAD
ncbi:MAG: flagellar assembly protein FliW [Chromatiales bacterium]|nr:flagellar assembly protein FliW [Chromatiales bacterium]